MHTIHRHIGREQLETFSAGASEAEEIVRVEEHLLVCEHCRGQLEEADYAMAMKSAAAQWDQTVGRPHIVPALVAAAGLIFLAVVAARWHSVRHPAVTVDLIAMRTNEIVVAPAGRPLELRPDLTGLPAMSKYRLEVVDGNGRAVWEGHLLNPGGVAILPAQTTGTYFVRVSSQAGELLREYGLRIGT